MSFGNVDLEAGGLERLKTADLAIRRTRPGEWLPDLNLYLQNVDLEAGGLQRPRRADLAIRRTCPGEWLPVLRLY